MNRLFDPGEPLVPESQAGDSYTRRLTRRRQLDLVNGIHPATKLELIDVDGATCGTCVHMYRRSVTVRDYLKCGQVAETGGPGTDVRAKWPGCVKWESTTTVRHDGGQ